MAIYKWTKENDLFLKSQWSKMKIVELEKILGANKYQILRRVRHLNLPKKPLDNPRSQYVQWTEEMDEFLTAKYLLMGNEAIARELKVSQQAVMRRMSKLGLQRDGAKEKHFQWTVQRELELEALFYNGHYFDDISQALDISMQQLKRKIKALGLKRAPLTKRQNVEKSAKGSAD